MTNLLLITDVPRLMKIFSQLSDIKEIRLRIANSLEKGAEEIVADKPDLVFVQTHLSGLSAEILLMHLKKQLGRKRSRFVLLCPADQVNTEVVKLYQGHLDSSPDNDSLFDDILEEIASLTPKRKTDAPPMADANVSIPGQQPSESADTEPLPQAAVAAVEQEGSGPVPSEAPVPLVLQQITENAEPTVEDEGAVYAPRPRLSVYSEFTSSFDNAVNSMQPPEPVTTPLEERPHAWGHEEIETVDTKLTRSKRATFLLWFAPVVVAVIVITMIQHRKSKPEALVVTPAKPALTVGSSNKAASAAVAASVSKQPVSPAPSIPPQPAATGAEAQLSERAVLSAIAENRAGNGQAKGAQTAPRLTALPNFIPRYGLDKGYAATNPGWERYKGEVTEFKIFREGPSIKAIQVIDRGGRGVPESFMKEVLKQVSRKPVFTLEGADRKEGYLIQRGQVAENLSVVYYRDEQGGKLRAFVMTWK